MARKKLTFEEGMQELEEIVRTLEQGQMPLEESFKAFERATVLQKLCRFVGHTKAPFLRAGCFGI